MTTPSILVVEDNKTLRRLLEYRLAKRFDVRVAENGERALEAVAERVPDLIVSDIMMPVMDGFALLAALCAQPATEAVPFIFLTAKTDDLSRQKGLKKGVDDYLTKPFDVDHLITASSQIVQRSQLYQSKLNAKIGRDFSDRLLPREMPVEPGYRAMFFSRPKEDGGGDLFDWTRAEDGSYLFTVGDIMGKGLQAKFYAFSLPLLHPQHDPRDAPRHDREPGGADDARQRDADPGPGPRGDLRLAAAHALGAEDAPTASSTPTRATAGPSSLTGPNGPRASSSTRTSSSGSTRETEYEDRAFALPPGSALLCYTDGLNEQVTGAQRGHVRRGRRRDGSAPRRRSLRPSRPVHTLLSWLLRQRSEAALRRRRARVLAPARGRAGYARRGVAAGEHLPDASSRPGPPA